MFHPERPKLQIRHVSQSSIASRGFDFIVREIAGKGVSAVGCEKGMRRGPAAQKVLDAANVSIANDSAVSPALNYADFLNYNFSCERFGVTVLGKTSRPFRYLFLFNDDSNEEKQQIKEIAEILKVEVPGVLYTFVIAHVRDSESLMALA